MGFLILFLGTSLPGVADCRPPADLAPLADLRLRVEAEIPSPFRGTCGEIRWSPDGTQLAMTGSDGIYLSAYPVDAPPRRILEIDPPIDELIWTADGRSIVVGRSWRDPRRSGGWSSELVAIDVSSGTTRILRSEAGVHFVELLPLEKSCFATMDGLTMPSRPLLLDTEGNLISRSRVREFDVAWLAGDGLWAMPAGSAETRPIPFPAEIYTNVHPSLRRERIALVALVDHAVRAVVIDYEGRIQRVLPYGFDVGQWSADGRFLMGCELEDDGHDLTGGEVGLLDAESGKYVRVTNTPDRIEYGVDWCETTGRVVYCDDELLTIHVGVLERKSGAPH